MSSAFTIFPVKKNASKPTRFKQEKILERRDKPQFLKVHRNKAKGILEASGYLIGTLESAVAYIIKHKKDVGDVPELQIYYNITLMITGHRQDLEKFLSDHLPSDTLAQADLRDPFQHFGPITNFNKRWLTSDMSRMLTLEESLIQFNDLKGSYGENYDKLVTYYHNQFDTYFAEAAGKHEITKAAKQKESLTFEEYRDSLGPFKYAETGILFLKHVKSHMGEVKKKETKKGGDTTFDKYFIVEPNNVVRVSLSTNSKTGTTSLTAKKEAQSSVTGSRSKAFRPFPVMFPSLYFNNENIYDAFIHDLKNHLNKLVGTLSNQYFANSDIHILPTDSEVDKLAKIEKFFGYLDQEYTTVRQNRLLNNAALTQYRPTANVPISSSFNVYQ